MAPDAADAPADRLTELFRRELSHARSDALTDGADADEITADLTERIRRLRGRNASDGATDGADGR